MQRNGALVRKKYMEYLGSTLAYSLSIYLATIVDGILVGQLLGPVPMTAITLTMPVVYVKNIVFMLFIGGGSVLAAGYLGERRHGDADRIFTLSVFGAAAGYTLLLILGIFLSDPVSMAVTRGGAGYDAVSAYLLPLLASGPVMAFSSGIGMFIRLDGKHKLATAIPIVANIVNLCCDYIFIRFFNWGIAGAGWATVTGYVCSLALLIPYFRTRERNFHFIRIRSRDLKLYPECLKVGLPLALIQACNVIRNYTMNSTISAMFGSAGEQVIAVCNNALFYAIMFAEGAATAMSSVCGTLFGEKDINGVRAVLRRSLAVAGGFCMVILLLLELFPVQFGLFYKVTDPSVQQMLGRYMRIFLIYIPLLAPLYVFRGFYQATKQAKAATAISVLEGAAVTVPVFLILSRLSTDLMWLGNCLGALISLAIVLSVMQRKARRAGADNFLMLGKASGDRSHEFSIDATEDGAGKAARETVSFIQSCGVPKKDANVLGISAEELCVNIARYAKVPPTEQIDLFIRALDDKILLKVRDSGIPFNPTEFVSDTGDLITGLGLIRAMNCEIEYDRIIGFNTTIITAAIRP